jgi:hypothetical protein
MLKEINLKMIDAFYNVKLKMIGASHFVKLKMINAFYFLKMTKILFSGWVRGKIKAIRNS